MDDFFFYCHCYSDLLDSPSVLKSFKRDLFSVLASIRRISLEICVCLQEYLALYSSYVLIISFKL